jgi:hypothetical protein
VPIGPLEVLGMTWLPGARNRPRAQSGASGNAVISAATRRRATNVSYEDGRISIAGLSWAQRTLEVWPIEITSSFARSSKARSQWWARCYRLPRCWSGRSHESFKGSVNFRVRRLDSRGNVCW